MMKQKVLTTMKTLITTLALGVVFQCPSFLLPTTSVAASTACGDVNNDGKVDIFDALLTLQYGLNLIPHNATNDANYLANGDVSPFNVTTSTVIGDGKIDVFDALIILQASVNLLKLPSCGSISLAITPANGSIAIGATLQFKAIETYSDNSTQDITASVIWSSSNTSAATIAANGTATAVATGLTTVTATSGTITGSTTLSVTSTGTVTIYW